MKKFLLAVVAGAVLGFTARAATLSVASETASGTPCGPLICKGNQECCVSPGPGTYQCVHPGGCRYN